MTFTNCSMAQKIYHHRRDPCATVWVMRVWIPPSLTCIHPEWINTYNITKITFHWLPCRLVPMIVPILPFQNEFQSWYKMCKSLSKTSANGCSGCTDHWHVQYAYNALYTLVLNPFLLPVVSKLTQTMFEVSAWSTQEQMCIHRRISPWSMRTMPWWWRMY